MERKFLRENEKVKTLSFNQEAVFYQEIRENSSCSSRRYKLIKIQTEIFSSMESAI